MQKIFKVKFKRMRDIGCRKESTVRRKRCIGDCCGVRLSVTEVVGVSWTVRRVRLSIAKCIGLPETAERRDC